MNQSSLSPTPYDAAVFPLIVQNNSQYRKRFHLSNYSAFKQSFVRGQDDVTPEYRLLVDTRLIEKRTNLENLRSLSLPQAGLGPVVQQLYQDKITEKQQLLALVAVAALAQQPGAAGWAAAQTFNEVTAAVFGVPSADVFNQLRVSIRDSLSTLPEPIKSTEAFLRTRALCAGTLETTIPTFVSNSTVIPSSDVGIVDANVVVQFLVTKMAAIGLSDWRVEITHKPIGSFRVYASKKLIRVPKSSVLRSRKQNRRLTPGVMEGIFAHEVLTHVVRAVHGESSKLQLLSQGLAGYLPGEEGIATYREQLCNGATDYAGGTMYLAIGLAFGLDRQGAKRSFREVYTILVDYFMVRNGGLVSASKSKAFATCCRIFICSPHLDIPLVLTRDIVYREGNIAICRLLQSNPEASASFDVGKYNPTDTTHVQALTSLGIL